MKIIFDLSSAQPQGSMTVNGGGEYALTIFRYILENSKSCSFTVLLNECRGTNTALEYYCKKNDIVIRRFNSNRQLEQIIVEEAPHTIVFPVCYSDYFDVNIDDKIKLVTIIHDLTPIWINIIDVKYGRYTKIDGLNWLRKIKNTVLKNGKIAKEIEKHKKLLHINDNQVVITVSYYSKQSFQTLLNLTSKEVSDIKVLYTPEKYEEYAYDIEGCRESLYLKQHNLQEYKYFFCLASCRWAKNNAIVLSVIDKMISQEKIPSEYKVLVLGVDEPMLRYFNRELANIDRFVFDKYISNLDLSVVYEKSHLLLFPSKLEGFGLPPIEAMKVGNVSACSTAMSIPEICGDAAIYFNPDDELSIEMAIMQSFDDNFMKIKKNQCINRYQELKQIREKGLSDLAKIIFSDGR